MPIESEENHIKIGIINEKITARVSPFFELISPEG